MKLRSVWVLDAHILHLMLTARPSLSSAEAQLPLHAHRSVGGLRPALAGRPGLMTFWGLPVGLGPSLLGVAAGDIGREKMLSLFRSSPLSAP